MSSNRYHVYVEISAKLEAWDKPSVIAAANDHSCALLVSSEAKRQAAELLAAMQLGEPIQFTLMAVLTYIITQPDLEKLSRITLDLDYSGIVAERRILRRLLKLIRREHRTFKGRWFRMANVAGSRADVLARDVYRGAMKPDGEITFEDIEAVALGER